MPARSPVVASLDEVVSLVRDGDVVGVGGFITSNKPMAVLRALMRGRRKGLTIVAGPSSLEVDLMIGLGMVERTITPYVGAEALAPIMPFFGKWAGRRFAVEEVDNGTLIAMLRARMQRLPFMPTSVAGTSIPELNQHVKVIDDPFGGPPVAVVEPIKLDVAILLASQADEFGNVQHQGAHFVDVLLAKAADRVIVQVERLVPNAAVRKAPLETSLHSAFVDAVVEVQYGAHPTASQNHYGLDAAHIQEYVRAAKSHLDGDEGPFREYLARYVDGPSSHAEYLEAVGVERIHSLALEGTGG